MSRILLVASLFTALASFSSTADARRFAQPPPGAGVSAPRDAASPTPRDAASPTIVSRAKVRAKLAQNRADNLARFRAYQAAGVFPRNTYTDGKLNVWIDEMGRICAAATIIKASGQVALVDHIGATNNFIRLADVKSGALMDWILTSGFTQDEIVAIQEPFAGEDDPAILVAWEAEDARLRAVYKQVDARIVKDREASLDAAADRLIRQNPKLAKQLAGA